MFEKKKIILNYQRANKAKDRKAKAFYDLLCQEVIDRSKILKKPEGSFLEIGARNNLLYNKLQSYNIEKKFFQTIQSPKIDIYNKNKLISEMHDNPFKEKLFDFCFNILSLNTTEKIVAAYKTTYSLLKENGKFICILPAEDSLKEFKQIFYNSFPSFNSFTPAIKMEDLGKIGSTAGFKNIVIDKSQFKLKVKRPHNLWFFIRNLGESNCQKDRKKNIFKKNQYNNLCNIINNEVIKKNLNVDISVNFFIGEK